MKEWICFILFRFILPLAFLTATVFRFCGFSLLYGCFALLNPLIARPTHVSLSQYTGRYLTGVTVLSGITLTAQVVFQSYVSISEGSKHGGNSSLLHNCSTLEKTLRQIGLQRINPVDKLNSVRIILPDIISFVVSLLVLIACRLLLKPRESSTSLAENGDETIRARLFRTGVIIADFLGNFLVIALTGLCGITTPSILNSIYFLAFLIVATVWSCGVRLSFWFSVYRFLILIYCGLHLVATYLNQFEFMADAWVDSFQNNTLVERILGLNRFIEVDCNEPLVLHLVANIKWTEYFNVAALLFFYFLVALEVRRRTTSSTLVVEFSPLISSSDEPVIIPSDDNSSSLIDVTAGSSEAQGLIQGRKSPVPRYHSMDKAEFNVGADLGETSELERRTPSPEDDVPKHCKESSHWETTKYVVKRVVTFAMRQSYIATLVTMMAWSITYPSWLTFVLLISACIIWMIPKKRAICMRFSPVIVFYAECLFTLTYVYGFDLTPSELPSQVADGYNLNDIGLVKYKYPVGPLAAQAAFTCVFWLTLYQFIWESKSTTVGTSRMDASLETLEGGTERDGHQKKTFAAVTAVKNCLWDFLCKYWIFLCGALFLLMALQEAVIFRMVYMVLFLCFVVSFQLNYAFWRCCVKIFWSSVIVYSMIVLVFIYVFQFEFVMEKWQNATGMSEDLMHDFGFRKYDTAALFLELLTPTSFLIFIILHLHYFQKTFLALSDVNRYRNSENRSIDEPEQENPASVDVNTSGGDKPQRFQERILLILSHFVIYVDHAIIIGWRLLEVHFHKLVLMSVFLVCVNDVNAVNVVFIIILVVFLVLGWKRLMSFVTMILCSLIVLTRMIYQLNLIIEEHLSSNCTKIKNMNTSISGLPPPFNSTFNNAHYLGLRKTDSMSHYVKDYMILVILLAFESVIIVHQKQYYNHPQHQKPATGIIFPGINRDQADTDLVHCAMFLVNYGFYKFGKEICFVMTIVTMIVRLDIFSVVYGVLLGFLLLLGRRKCRCLWPGYVILLALLIIIQYLSCVGVPMILCWQYPWLIAPQDPLHIKRLEVFLYLPDYIKPPDATKLIADFFQLLFVYLQWRVFGEEIRPNAAVDGGSNRSIAKEVSDVESGKKQNPVDDFVSYKDSYLDYVKVGVFYYSFWVTLLILFITGTVRISIFCLGYLVACFFFLWFGQDLLLKPIKTIQRMWTVVLVYSYLVILLKCCFQIFGCVYLDMLHCGMVQLFNIVCLQSDRYTQTGAACGMDKDMSGMSWDAASFACLLFLIRIYRTWYFQHIVTDLKVDNHLASRGSELINLMLFKRIEEHRQTEMSSLEKIRRKMEKIKLRQYRLHPQSSAPSNDHYVVIRSGDYYMFDDMTEDELDLQTEASEDKFLDDDAKKPGPIQILNAGFQGGTKVALDLWEHPSPTSPPPTLFERQDDVPFLSGQQMTPESDEKASGRDTDRTMVYQRETPSIDSPVLRNVGDDKEKLDDAEKSESFCDKLLNVLKLTILVLRASIEKVILFLKDLSQDYSAVSHKLKEEKEQFKHQMKKSCQGESSESDSQLIVDTEEGRTNPRPSQIDLHLGDGDRCNGNEIEKQKLAERTFHREMPIFFRLLVASFEVVLSHSDLLCYFAMVLNVLMSGSVVSLVYPILTFLWALLSTPRPSKAFWVFIITYTEVLIIIKYVFQFPFIPWNVNMLDRTAEKEVFDVPYVFGIEKKDSYAVFDIILLFCLFIHRSVLKQHGLWKDAEQSLADMENAELASRQATPATSPGDSKKKDFGGSGEPASHFDEDDHDGDRQEIENNDALVAVLPASREGGLEVDKEECRNENEQNDSSCCNRCMKSLGTFCHMLRNPRCSAATDVYARMFFCDLITFIIVIFGYASFGPGDSNDSPTTAFMNVAAVIRQNKIPASFLGMMLAQFILIIIDRAIYLRKQILIKLIFQVFLVALVHVWMFFALPQITGRRFVYNVAAQLWYFTKCIYFGFSSYQIRCGYPTRILGNFLTLKYNYINLFSFQAFLVIPFLLELRALMDWMFTDTTLALGSWLQMEDIYANIFVIRCNRRAEKTYPVKRGQKRQALVKYGLGGIILFLLIFIIWFPLLLFSLSESIYKANPPVSVTVGLKIQGYEPMFKMTAQGSDLKEITQEEYSGLRQIVPKSGRTNSFLDMYRREDIYKCRLLGMSAATWDITPPYLNRLMNQLVNHTAPTSMYFSLAFTREPAPSLSSETVTGEFERSLDSEKDKELLAQLADMLSHPSEDKKVEISNLFPRFVTVPASMKPTTVDYLFTNESHIANFSSGNGSLHLSNENSTGTKWWTIQQIEKNMTSDVLEVTSFNERIAPAGVLSLLSSYGVIGLYVSLVLVIGRFVRMWIQGLSFKIMFVELPNPDVLLKLCLDIYMVRESGELMLEEELFAQLIFLYRSPETLIKVTKHAKTD